MIRSKPTQLQMKIASHGSKYLQRLRQQEGTFDLRLSGAAPVARFSRLSQCTVTERASICHEVLHKLEEIEGCR